MRGIWLLVIVSILALPAITVAQTTEPVGIVSSGDDEVYRAYDNPSVYFDATAGLFAFGSIYDTETEASRSIDTTPEIFAASLRGGVAGEESGAGDYEFGELEDVQLPPIGDESRATRLPFVLFGSFDGEYGIVVVRQGSWVQVLIAFGVGEVDVISELEALATTLQSRWPSEDPIAVREDGLRTGGIWNMMPMPEDLPEGFVVDEEFEEGPAATVDAVVPVGTRAPEGGATSVTTDGATPVMDEATPVTANDVPTETPSTDRQVPLVPTLSPIDVTPPDMPVPTGSPDADAVEPTVEAIEPIDVAPPTEVPEATQEATSTGTPEPTAEAMPTEDPSQIIDPIQIVSPTPAATAPAVTVATSVMSERLAQPFDASVEIIIASGHYARNEDGSCSGSGLVDTLTVDGELVLREENGDALATTTIAGPGVLGYDTVLQEDVCYLTAQFTDVTARAEYVLVSGESVIGRFTYEDLASGEPALVVIGAE